MVTHIYTWHVDSISNNNINELFCCAIFSEQHLTVENLCMVLVKTISELHLLRSYHSQYSDKIKNSASFMHNTVNKLASDLLFHSAHLFNL